MQQTNGLSQCQSISQETTKESTNLIPVSHGLKGKSKYRFLLELQQQASPSEANRQSKLVAKSEYFESRFELIRKSERQGYTSLKEDEWGITFDSLDVNDYNREAIKRLNTWDPKQMKRGGFLFGPVGTGKSTLCKALINKWAKKDYKCLFISITEAMDKLKDAIDENTNTTVQLEMDKLTSPDLLVFDDLGAEKTSEWTQEKIFTLVEKRARQGKHTWFTSNLSPDLVEKIYKDRIYDRIIEFSQFIRVEGPSFRQEKYSEEF